MHVDDIIRLTSDFSRVFVITTISCFATPVTAKLTNFTFYSLCLAHSYKHRIVKYTVLVTQIYTLIRWLEGRRRISVVGGGSLIENWLGFSSTLYFQFALFRGSGQLSQQAFSPLLNAVVECSLSVAFTTIYQLSICLISRLTVMNIVDRG